MAYITRGSSLIESLVALAVFAIGSAATGAWLAWSMALDARASRSLAATSVALNLMARVRANPEGVHRGYYVDSASASVDCARGCNTAELAADDVDRFHHDIVERVGPAARGWLLCDEVACVIRVTWQGRDELVWSFRP